MIIRLQMIITIYSVIQMIIEILIEIVISTNIIFT